MLDSSVSPTVRRIGPYRFFFYASDLGEPAHIHVERDRAVAKFWLEPISLDYAQGMSPRELSRAETLIEENAEQIRRTWDEVFHP